MNEDMNEKNKDKSDLKLCKVCKKVYTAEKDGICITCKANSIVKRKVN